MEVVDHTDQSSSLQEQKGGAVVLLSLEGGMGHPRSQARAHTNHLLDGDLRSVQSWAGKEERGAHSAGR